MGLFTWLRERLERAKALIFRIIWTSCKNYTNFVETFYGHKTKIMSLKKKYLKSKPVCKVSFEFIPEKLESAKTVEIVGDFNNWEPIAMRKVKSVFTRTIDLEAGKGYQFRYRINGEHWLNDDAADEYVPNGLSGDNSVVTV
jgi:1,4-alpha-glucan branching enzyme